MLKVMTIVGTRPEIIKLSCVMRELDKYTNHICGTLLGNVLRLYKKNEHFLRFHLT